MQQIVDRAHLEGMGSPPSTEGNSVLEMSIPGLKVGLVIGKGGETIRQLQDRTEVKMVMIQDSNAPTAQDKPLRITGEATKCQVCWVQHIWYVCFMVGCCCPVSRCPDLQTGMWLVLCKKINRLSPVTEVYIYFSPGFESMYVKCFLRASRDSHGVSVAWCAHNTSCVVVSVCEEIVTILETLHLALGDGGLNL